MPRISDQQEFSDADWRVVATGDQSKKFKFDLSGLTTGTTYTWTVGAAALTFLGTPSSANLAALLSDETGTGAAVFANTPTLVTPILGVAAATSISFGGTALDSHAVGTWTPSMTFNNSSTNVAYAVQSGWYIKLGRLVIAGGRLTLTNNGTGVGIARITNFPFASANLTPSFPGSMILLAGGSAATGIRPTMSPNATAAVFYIPGAASDALATDTNVTDTFSADFTIVYEAAA